MESPRRTRNCSFDKPALDWSQCRGQKQICLGMEETTYQEIWQDPKRIRQFLDDQMKEHPKLFPQAMQQLGYRLDGMEPESSKMPGIALRRIRIPGTNNVYFLRPSFVMPYMTGRLEDVEKGLYLRTFGVPYEALAYCFGRNSMYWYRLECRLGTNSLVGTTVRNGELPCDLVADEHHATVNRQKVYAAVTAGAGVVLGVGYSATADEQGLRAAYGDFRDEAENVEPNYAPRSVNTDGWMATQRAWRSLYPLIALVLCFLHGYLKVRDRCRRKFPELRRRIWDVYRAATGDEFRERMDPLKQWYQQQTFPTKVSEAVQKLCNRTDEYAVSYDHPGCHRTSNLVDRLMNLLDRVIHSGRRLHGDLTSAEQRLRGWALLLNFRPFSHRHQYRCPYQSAAHRLNGETYHSHWLHNLMISASLGGFRT